MFSSAAHFAIHFARRKVFAAVTKQPRFISVSTVSSTKYFYTESVLLSEKPNKSAKAKRINNKKVEESQLYPDEVENTSNYDLLGEFDLLMDDHDDKRLPVKRDLKLSKVESVAKKSKAADKMSSVQETLVRLESVTKKSEAVDEGPSMQEVGRSDWSESVARKSEAVKEVKIHGPTGAYLKNNDSGERLSDSDSESDTEDSFGGFRKRLPNLKLNLDDLKITRLNRRSEFLRDMMEKATSGKNRLILANEISGIFALASMGITPESLFLCYPHVLKYYPGDISKTALYTIPAEDMIYWASKMRNPHRAMIGLYQDKNLRRTAKFSEPEMPLTIIVDRIWDRIRFAEIINSACIASPRLLITSKACINPWHGRILRNTSGNVMSLNHNFHLTWTEIREKIGENDRVYVLELPTGSYNHGSTESVFSSLPSVYLYDHSFWDSDNITLVVVSPAGRKVDEYLSSFLLEREASRIDVGVPKPLIYASAFHMVLFEMRRQRLAAGNRNLRKSG